MITIPDNLANAKPSILLFEKENTIKVLERLSKLVNKLTDNIIVKLHVVSENTEIINIDIIQANISGRITLETRYPLLPNGVTHK